ncbi:MAG TPA: hypothetical protein VKY19_11405 [Ktedonosporobacter sp.]|jgi:hypothetical protein|nr:hypothetical protein [Ktedonosporobacter sp.]
MVVVAHGRWHANQVLSSGRGTLNGETNQRLIACQWNTQQAANVACIFILRQHFSIDLFEDAIIVKSGNSRLGGV